MAALLAFIPIIVLIILMTTGRSSAMTAYLLTFLLTLLIACSSFSMTVNEMLAASLEGAISALWPICILIFSSLLLFNLSIGEEEKKMLCNILADDGEKDNEASILLIALGLGSILEGLIGFGVSLVIPLSFMISAGYDRIRSTRAVLIAVSIPTSFGSLGMPQTSLATATGLSVNEITALSLIYELPLLILLPYSVLAAYYGKFTIRRGFLPSLLFLSVIYAASYAISGFIAGAAMPAIAGGIALSAILGIKRISRIKERDFPLRSMLPIAMALLMLCLPAVIPPLRALLGRASFSMALYPGSNPETIRFYLIDTPGILILLGALSGAFIIKLPISAMKKAAARTVKENWKTFISMCLILSISKLMSYSGMTEAIAESIISVTGPLFPSLSTAIGILGSFITGSNTSANMLFGPIQAKAAIGIGLSPAMLSVFNAIGASIGKIISPQNMILSSSVCDGITARSISKTLPVFFLQLLIATLCCCISAGM